MLENVLPLKSDDMLKGWIGRMKQSGYSVESMNVRYSDYGAATRRRRLIVFGVQDGKAEDFVKSLRRRRRKGSTVRTKIEYLKLKEKLEVED